MTNQAVMIDVPEGYEVTGGYRTVKTGEYFLRATGPIYWEITGGSYIRYPILRKIAPRTKRVRFSVWVDLTPDEMDHVKNPEYWLGGGPCCKSIVDKLHDATYYKRED